MTSIAPPKPLAPPSLAPLQPPAGAAQAAGAETQRAADRIEPQNSVSPSELKVQLDKEAGRFVQTLTDITTEETLRRYPSEAQLAYSRAVMAYLRALAR